VSAEAAAVTATFALSLPVIIGAAALAIDASHWAADSRRNQQAAEAVAFSAATNYASTQSLAQAQATAYAVANQYGLTNGTNGIVWAVNIGPKSGPYAGNSRYAEAIINRPEQRFFSGLFLSAANTSGYAVAGIPAGGYCIIGLAPMGTLAENGATIYVENGSSIEAPDCSVADNGTGANAFEVVGGSSVKAKSESIVGGYNIDNDGSFQNTPTTGQSAAPDPYAGVANPSTSGCTYTFRPFTSYSPTVEQFYPGTYCGPSGLTVEYNAQSINLNPGVYIIDGGCFCMQGVTVTGTGGGVTIILTGGDSNSSNYATMQIGDNSTVTLTAPTTGSTAGLVFYADRRSPTTTASYLGLDGNATMDITGTLYFPSQQLFMENNVSLTSSTCTLVIAYEVQITGGTSYATGCTGSSTTGGGVRVVE
jgi:hypothetical protein